MTRLGRCPRVPHMSKIRIFLMLTVMFTLLACGLNNTMYNARKYFREAQARPLNSNGRPSPQAVADYTKTIQKCGIILTERKDSKIADDALFLMAKALYFKGNSAFQAKDQFEALIAGFPNSRHIPEAYIYLARVLREINRPQESEKLLEEFVRNQRFIKHHPRALLTLAEFEITDKDFYRAQFWLERLIKEYPKTKEFHEAYMLFGRNYYVQGNFDASLREFEKLTGFRRVDKGIRLEARYYIALNLFEKGLFDRSMRMVQALLNDETRPDKLSMVRVLNARLLLNTGKATDGVAEVDAIARAYPRTNASATAYYYVGDHYFYAKDDINQATTSYNRVRTEFPTSELITISQRKVSALNQLKQKQNLNFRTNPQQYADYHTLAAENYLDPFALPDSALVMYDRIIRAADKLYPERDSLASMKANMKSEMDSLRAIIDSLPELMEPKTDDTKAVLMENGMEDVAMPQDSTSVDEITPIETTNTASGPSRAELNARKDQLNRDIQRLEQQLSSLNSVLARFEMEIQPFAMFAKAHLINKLGRNAAEIDAIFALMRDKYPTHKYTNALRALRNGEPVRLVDPEEERLEKKLDNALGMYPSSPDSMLTTLLELVDSRYPLIKLRANFRLGWYYSFEARDTTLAIPFLKNVLEHEQGGDYATMTRRFFDGVKYVVFRDITLSDPTGDTSKEEEKDSEELQPEDDQKLPDLEQEDDIEVGDTSDLPPIPEDIKDPLPKPNP